MKKINFLQDNLNKRLFILFLIIYFLLGVVASLKVGISHDEFHEQQNWEYNINVVKNFFDNEVDIYDFRDKYRVFIRWSKGQDINAGCGQLATKKQ